MLHLAKLMPTQWRTIAPVLPRPELATQDADPTAHVAEGIGGTVCSATRRSAAGVQPRTTFG